MKKLVATLVAVSTLFTAPFISADPAQKVDVLVVASMGVAGSRHVMQVTVATEPSAGACAQDARAVKSAGESAICKVYPATASFQQVLQDFANNPAVFFSTRS